MAQIPFIKQNQVSAGISKTRSNAVKVYCSEAIAAGDVLSVIGMDTSGTFLSVAKADANGAVTLNSGQLFVADYDAASGDFTPVALPWKVIDGVDTSLNAVGDPVWLSNTPGSYNLAKGAVKIGSVLTSAASGSILLAPHAMVPADGTTVGSVQSLIGSGAVDYEVQMLQPAGTVLVDAGHVISTATVGNANIVIRVGTGTDGQQICADATFVNGSVAAIGSSLQVASASQGQGNASMSFVDDAPLYTASARVLYYRFQVSATVTAGAARPFLRFVRL
tara:strand:- start:234 stop:1067 length:834 start_codon:yes stop_codon:yes gene_type:complete